MYTTSTCHLKLHLKRYTFSLSTGKSTSVLAKTKCLVHSIITAAPGILFDSHLDDTVILGH